MCCLVGRTWVTRWSLKWLHIYQSCMVASANVLSSTWGQHLLSSEAFDYTPVVLQELFGFWLHPLTDFYFHTSVREHCFAQHGVKSWAAALKQAYKDSLCILFLFSFTCLLPLSSILYWHPPHHLHPLLPHRWKLISLPPLPVLHPHIWFSLRSLVLSLGSRVWGQGRVSRWKKTFSSVFSNRFVYKRLTLVLC